MGMYIAAVPCMACRKFKPFLQLNINGVSFGRDINYRVEKTVGETFYYFKPYRFLFRKIYFESFFYIRKSSVIVKYNISFMVDVPFIYSNRKINAVAFRSIIN